MFIFICQCWKGFHHQKVFIIGLNKYISGSLEAFVELEQPIIMRTVKIVNNFFSTFHYRYLDKSVSNLRRNCDILLILPCFFLICIFHNSLSDEFTSISFLTLCPTY